MNRNCKFVRKAPVFFLTGTLLLSGCAGGSLTTREKGAGIGALGGAAAGGLIGAAVGRPGVGAAIGGGLGLGAGMLVGDQLQGQENENYRRTLRALITEVTRNDSNHNENEKNRLVYYGFDSRDFDPSSYHSRAGRTKI